MTVPSASEFAMAAAATRPASPTGNTELASRIAAEYREIVKRYAAYQPRTLQKYLGPSELGSPCDRQVAGKMAGLPATNHVADPWPSLVGTWCHEGMADCFIKANAFDTYGRRFLAETRVAGHPNHPGTSDLYDWKYKAVVDHKFLGDTTHAKIQRADGPPRKYVVQILLYAQGFRNMGFPVERVILAAWPRTKSKIAGLYIWERPHTPDDIALLEEVNTQTDTRYAWATALADGRCRLEDVPMVPDDDECYFCPFYRPQSAYDEKIQGCPGNRDIKFAQQGTPS